MGWNALSGGGKSKMQTMQNDEIELLAQNEETLSRLYQVYASRFSEYKEFWMELAGEEKNHAAWIRTFGQRASEGLGLIKRKRFKAAAIKSFLNHTEKEIENAKAPEYQSINALSVAHYIEESLIERRYFEVFESDSAELKKLLQDLDEATRTHAAKIKMAWDRERQRRGKK
jgi:hypothetical protein